MNESIAAVFEEKYKVRFHSIRNISDSPADFNPRSKAELNLPPDKKIILLQGAGINVDRGAEELIDAMPMVENAILLIIGGGDVWEIMNEKIRRQGLAGKVILIRKIPKAELMHYTYNATIGLSIDKNTNLNYYYSLPNKIFDYINAGVPVLASRLPEIEKIIRRYGIGDFIGDHQPATIAAKLNELLSSPLLEQYRLNTRKAKAELSWKQEKLKLIGIIEKTGGFKHALN